MQWNCQVLTLTNIKLETGQQLRNEGAELMGVIPALYLDITWTAKHNRFGVRKLSYTFDVVMRHGQQ